MARGPLAAAMVGKTIGKKINEGHVPVGMRQLMTGNRKFALKYIERDDIAAITREAAEVSGIPHVMDVDKDEVENILNS
jgi:hypothetical protein